ncbi:MAG: PQQ-like beta-propeller repeat protein [Planctomycetes bacterium]|nr:PQQ-like beta-propeller repeat protein [Planctomycetota bacterium]
MRCLPRLVVLLGLCVLSRQAVEAADWPQWRGPARDGHSSETGLFDSWGEKGPELAWQAKGLGGGHSGVSVAGGKIFTSGNQKDGQAIVAISAADGKKLWSTTITSSVPRHGSRGARTTPSVDGERLYVVTSNGSIAALSTTSGKVLWQKDFIKEWKGQMMSGWGFSESPLVDGDRVLCTPGGPEAGIVALDKVTGKEIWRSKIGGGGRKGAGYSSIVISNGGGVKQYVQLMGKGVVGVRASDGKHLWTYKKVANGTANISTPIVTGDYVFASTGYGTGSVLLKLKATGDGGVEAEEEYFLKANVLQNKHGGMVLVDGYIYCGHGNGSGMPICVELKTGKVAWGPQSDPRRGETSVIYADGHIVYRFQNGEVALVEATPKGFKEKAVFKPVFRQGQSWAHPAIADGKLYLREQDRLMCYKLK